MSSSLEDAAAKRKGANKSNTSTGSSWQSYYESLQAFYNEHDHAFVPSSHPLFAWTQEQRGQKSALSQTQQDLLNTLQFVWNKQDKTDTRWIDQYAQLEAFQKQHGHCSVSKEVDLKLNTWVTWQRRLFKQGTLRSDRQALLQKLEGFDLDPTSSGRTTAADAEPSPNNQNNITNKKPSPVTAQKWEAQYQKLVQYHAQHGHCNLPSTRQARHTTPALASLVSWANHQRLRRYPTPQALHKGQRRPLTPQELEKLDALGFVWKPSEKWEDTWQQKYDRLVAYHQTHGHCRVPQQYEPDPELGLFVHVQRRLFHGNKLDPLRKAKLDAIGFCWSASTSTTATTKETSPSSPQTKSATTSAPKTTKSTKSSRRNEQWEIMFQRLLDYRSEHDHTFVPSLYDPDPKLGSWVMQQRQLFRNQRLPQDRYTRLKDIGFVFEVRLLEVGDEDNNNANTSRQQGQWMDQYSRLQQFYDRYGHCRVPKDYEKDPSLANWVAKQRTLYRKGVLLASRQDLLNAVHFIWNPGARGTWVLKEKVPQQPTLEQHQHQLDGVSNEEQVERDSNDKPISKDMQSTAEEVSTTIGDGASKDKEEDVANNNQHNKVVLTTDIGGAASRVEMPVLDQDDNNKDTHQALQDDADEGNIVFESDNVIPDNPEEANRDDAGERGSAGSDNNGAETVDRSTRRAKLGHGKDCGNQEDHKEPKEDVLGSPRKRKRIQNAAVQVLRKRSTRAHASGSDDGNSEERQQHSKKRKPVTPTATAADIEKGVIDEDPKQQKRAKRGKPQSRVEANSKPNRQRRGDGTKRDENQQYAPSEARSEEGSDADAAGRASTSSIPDDPYQIGQRVSVHWPKDKKIRNGNIKDRDEVERKILVQYESGGGSKWFSLRKYKVYLLNISNLFEGTLDVEASNNVKVGTTLSVWWSAEKRFYTGLVTKFDKEHCKHFIEYFDGDSEWTMLNRRKVRVVAGPTKRKTNPSGEISAATDIQIGTKLSVWWPAEKQFYCGVVTKVNDNSNRPHFIEYDDGDKEWVDLNRRKLRLVEKKAR